MVNVAISRVIILIVFIIVSFIEVISVEVISTVIGRKIEVSLKGFEEELC